MKALGKLFLPQFCRDKVTSIRCAICYYSSNSWDGEGVHKHLWKASSYIKVVVWTAYMANYDHLKTKS